jgi:predicted nucleotidyltransferase
MKKGLYSLQEVYSLLNKKEISSIYNSLEIDSQNHIATKSKIKYILDQYSNNNVYLISKSCLVYLIFGIEFFGSIYKKFGKALFSSFIYGSVATGEADTGRSNFEIRCYIKNKYHASVFERYDKSDIDLAVVVSNPGIFFDQFKEIVSNIAKKFPKNLLISVLLFPKDELLDEIRSKKSPNIYKRLMFVTKTLNLHKSNYYLKHPNTIKDIENDIKYEKERRIIRDLISYKFEHSTSTLLDKNTLFTIAPIWSHHNLAVDFKGYTVNAFPDTVLRIKLPPRSLNNIRDMNFKNKSDFNKFIRSKNLS